MESYYAENYNILLGSEDEDQIYEVCDGRPIYRTEHQVRLLQSKVDAPHGSRLLDYGCAKGSTLRTLTLRRRDIIPFMFDVSEKYVAFWESFVPPGNWALGKPNAEWASSFDIVTSFFSLEHIAEPVETLRTIFGLLKVGGLFYGVVPNVLTNVADFIVADHVNHFTAPSIRRLVEAAGLRLREIDDTSHRGAFVIVAAKPTDLASSAQHITEQEIKETVSALTKVATFWNDAASRIQLFEANVENGAPLGVYGAGFYGAFVAASLLHPERIICFLDQNPFLQGKHLAGRPIVSPSQLPSTVKTLLVGLNPAHAKTVIADISVLAKRQLQYFYL